MQSPKVSTRGQVCVVPKLASASSSDASNQSPIWAVLRAVGPTHRADPQIANSLRIHRPKRCSFHQIFISRQDPRLLARYYARLWHPANPFLVTNPNTPDCHGKLHVTSASVRSLCGSPTCQAGFHCVDPPAFGCTSRFAPCWSQAMAEAVSAGNYKKE